ncbi:DUF3304 domain-containing protein [Pseudomonas agarici]|uniref:DUF3304 domain-containing protein n=1 Tax=Pseudomonas agarici TaxID=46677 RepID=UPI0015A478C1|nr:DUF3304 domain-containing protein [Pseudomonas agarici]NWC11962.1 DUF3304 domain-containing protein [Pseudomonas agarici]
MSRLHNKWRGLLQAISVGLLITTLVGCNGEEPDKGPASASISGYNHTEEYIHRFFVDESWGGNVFAYSGGGGFVCCINYPREWRPDLAATVRWSTSASWNKPYTGTTWHEQVVPIEYYDKLGTRLNVHFLPDNKVRLLIWNGSAGSKGYRGPDAPVKPADWPKTLYLEDLK